MKSYKIISGILIHILAFQIWGAFIFAIWERNLIIALLCPLAFGCLKGMWYIDIVKGDEQN